MKNQVQKHFITFSFAILLILISIPSFAQQPYWRTGGNPFSGQGFVTTSNNYFGTDGTNNIPVLLGAKGNQHQLFIDNLSDFVGIGMDNLSNMHPQTNLHVNSLTYDPLYFTHSIATIRLTNLTSTNSGFNLRADNADAILQNSENNGSMIFSTRNSSSSIMERMRITTANNIPSWPLPNQNGVTRIGISRGGLFLIHYDSFDFFSINANHCTSC